MEKNVRNPASLIQAQRNTPPAHGKIVCRRHTFLFLCCLRFYFSSFFRPPQRGADWWGRSRPSSEKAPQPPKPPSLSSSPTEELRLPPQSGGSSESTEKKALRMKITTQKTEKRGRKDTQRSCERAITEGKRKKNWNLPNCGSLLSFCCCIFTFFDVFSFGRRANLHNTMPLLELDWTHQHTTNVTRKTVWQETSFPEAKGVSISHEEPACRKYVTFCFLAAPKACPYSRMQQIANHFQYRSPLVVRKIWNCPQFMLMIVCKFRCCILGSLGYVFVGEHGAFLWVLSPLR
jgi:hypothetical protein